MNQIPHRSIGIIATSCILLTLLVYVSSPSVKVVLESMTEPGFPSPAQLGSGKVVRIDPQGNQTVVAEGLSFPGAITLGPDGALYVSNISFGAPPGLGQIVRIEVP